MLAPDPPLRLFGVPAWSGAAGPPTLFKPERPYQLLACLACRDQWLSRDELAEWLWPERAAGVARSNLRKVLLLAQRLPGLPPLQQRGELLQWAPESDLRRFEAACRERRFDAALALYRPPLLQGMEPGLPRLVGEWLGFERQRLAGLWREAAGRRLDSLADDPGAIAALCEDLRRHEPLDEAFVVAQAEAQVALGHAAQALRLLEEHAQRLTRETGLETSAELRGWVARLRPSPSPAAPPVGRPAPPNWPSGLVGRRAEQAQLMSLLAGPACRVLTLTGPGGIGKSSLARASLGPGESVPPAVADAACWVALADLDDAGQLPARIAASLRLMLQGGAPPWPQIERHLNRQRWLLVLDNAEHLQGLAPLLEQLLAACPGLKLLHTSRNRLNLAGEWLLPLEGLPLPDNDESELELLRRCDSVRLFERRALSASPTFRLAEHAADVVRLLHAVQGLPLAIELAAAWVRLLPVREIVAELATSVDLLDAGPAPARDRSLRGSFARSWRLLSPAEQGCLASLALLPAAFGRDMAQQVAGSALPMLASLVDKSLLRADGDGRFSLHPLVRQCAAERADGPGEALARHAAYMGRWLARYGDPRGPQITQALAEIERELPHARAAWSWALAHGRPEVVSQATLGLLMYFESRGLWQEAIDTFSQAAAAFDESTPVGARAVAAALRALAPMQYRSGHLAEAEASARRALRLARRLGEKRFLKVSLNHIGLSLSRRGLYAEALRFFAEALKQARRDGDPYYHAAYTGNIAMAQLALEQVDAAVEGFREAAELHRAQHNLRGMATQLYNHGDALQVQSRWADALIPLQEALRVCEQQGLTVQRSIALLGLGISNTALGRHDEALGQLTRALAEVRASGEHGFESLVLRALAQWHLARRELVSARERTVGALAIADAEPAQLGALLTHAQGLAAQGEAAAAAGLLHWLIAQPALQGDDRHRARQALAGLGLESAALADCADHAPADGTLAGVLAEALAAPLAPARAGATAPTVPPTLPRAGTARQA